MPTIRFDTFCAQVCSAIRWEPARRMARAELSAHLEDHAEALAAKGLAPDLAAEQAVAAMGDPYELGRALDRAHPPTLPRLSRVLALAGALLLLAGIAVGARNSSGLFALEGLFPQAPALELSYGSTSQLLAEGAAVGGGRLGSYVFTPSGRAGLTYDPQLEAEIDLQIQVPITAAARPWLPAPAIYHLEGAWTDESSGSGAVHVGWEADYLLGTSGWLHLIEPTPGARQFTITLTAPSGEEIFFTVTLPEKVPPL